MTSTQLKAQIDSAITSKSQNNTITPSNVGASVKSVVDYIDQEIDNIQLTPGATGAQGIQGIPGPIGPAGLEWRGAWVSGTSYIADDAVGYNGASWFCILATSGTTVPSTDTAHWALLAAQGATGPIGPAGAGAAAKTTAVLLSNGNSAPFTYSTVDFVKFLSSSAYSLPPAPVLGEVKHVLTTASCTLWASPNPGNDGSNNNFLTSDGNGNSSMTLLANKSYRFTYIGRYGGTYGFWTVEIMNNI